jgi:micrococcal nuclease
MPVHMITVMKVRIIETTQMRGVIASFALLIGLASCSGSSPLPNGQADLVKIADGKIVKVVDGDTVDIDIDGHTERVRLIGVNTPETKHPTKPIECFGPEASAYLTQLLPKGTTVRIERDVEARDRYGRMLLYLYLGTNDLFINLDLVARGYGTPMSIEPNTFHRNDFVRAAAQAEAANVGLWKACR